MDFQARLAAWFCVGILTEREAPPLWDWPETGTYEVVESETDQPTDDLLVKGSASARAFIQAKFRVQLSQSATSSLGKAIDQFVSQYRADASTLDPDYRLVLATGPDSSSLIRQQLPRVLERIRALADDKALDTAAVNAPERNALRVVVGQVKRAWLVEVGSGPSDEELRSLLKRVRVSVFDLYDDGAQLQQSLGFLRASVLRDSGQAGAAWDSLSAAGTGIAIAQSRTDRQLLQRTLSNRGYGLKPARSYQEDIEKLNAHTRRTLDRLESFSVITGEDGSPVKIGRASPGALKEVLETSSVVVTGDPGAGKSGTLYETAKLLAERDLVVLASDSLGASSLGQLRDELNLEHEVLDVLASWPGTDGAFLLIDALDAARGAKTQEALTELLGAVAVADSRWRVGVAMRRFDLRYSTPLQDIFRGGTLTLDPTYRTDEFGALNHFNVPLLLESEMSQLDRIAPRVGAVLDAGTDELRELARTPFNLRLLADLVDQDVASEELEPITSQLQLLDKYWTRRILDSESGGDALEPVLRAACEVILSSRTMKIDRSVLQEEASFREPLDELLSSNVLTEEDTGATVRREVLSFAHHVLFDYAAARLLFRGLPAAIVDRTAARPELVLIIRPSYDLHYRHLWELDQERQVFWDAAFAVASTDGVPVVAKIIAPGVAADLIAQPGDYARLVAALRSENEETREVAEEMLAHLIGARLLVSGRGSSIPDNRRDVWAALTEQLSEEIAPASAYPLRTLLIDLAEDMELSDEAQRSVGLAARRLYEWALGERRYHGHVIRTGIEVIAKTFATDPAESDRLLRIVLGEARLTEHGYLEMPTLARAIEPLFDTSSQLAGDIYATAFAFEESSDERTQMSGGVLALTSHRSQDYRMAHYSLGESFEAFIRAAPTEAIDALTSVRRTYAERKAHGGSLEEAIGCGEGGTFRIEPDHSSIWDSGGSHDDEDKMLDTFEAWSTEQLGLGRRQTKQLVDLLGAESRPAAIWRRLVRAATQHPQEIAHYLAPILSCPEALTSSDLSDVIGSFFTAGFNALSQTDRRRIERAIMDLPEFAEESGANNGRERGENARDRLLGCVDQGLLVSARARAHLQSLLDADAVPPNEHLSGFSGWRSSDWSAEQELTEQGVDLSTEVHRRIRELEAPVREFAEANPNGSPATDAAGAITQPLAELWEALNTSAGQIDPELAKYAWQHATEAAHALARTSDLTPDSPIFEAAERVLLDASQHELPTPVASSESFDNAPSWSSPAPRIEAASGLLCLAFHEASPQTVMDCVEQLASDPHHTVRFQVMRRLGLLRASRPDLMWRIADNAIADEQSLGVLSALAHSLPRLGPAAEHDRIATSAVALYERAEDGRPGADKLRELVIEQLADLYIWRGNAIAEDFILNRVVGSAAAKPEEASHILHRVREPFTHGEVDSGNTEEAAVRERALDLTRSLLDVVVPGYQQAEAELQERGQVDDGDAQLDRARRMVQIADTLTHELYFATGVFDEAQNRPESTSVEQRRRLYEESGSLMTTLSGLPFPSITHHVLETLQAFIPFDPKGVFLRIGATVKAGQAGGYQADSLGAGLFATLVERYLAEHRTLLQEDDECRDLLIEILGIFVEAGWPQVRRLTYGLQDIYR